MSAQTYSEALSNYARQQARYAAKLQQRLADGTMTQADYDSRMSAVRDGLDNQTDAYWSEFETAIAEEAAKLPKTIQTAAVAVVDYAGTTAGKVVGSAVGGIGSGLFKSIGVYGFLLVGLALAVWAFTIGPLSALKIKKL